MVRNPLISADMRRLETKAYVSMPPHSKCNVNPNESEIISCRTISKKLAETLLDHKEFENGVDREMLKLAGIEDNSTWWYNAVDDLIMIKGRTGRYYIKKLRRVKNRDLVNSYQIACDNYSVICGYVSKMKRAYLH